MRILALAHQWIPAHCAGAETMLHGMLRALTARGHEVDVTLSRQDGDAYELDGIRLWPGRHPQSLIGGADVLVTHLESTPAASLLGRWNSVPVVQVLHNTLRITREWVAGGTPALVVCNSEWMRAAYAAALGDWMPRSLVVRPLIDPDEYRTTPGDRVTLVNLRRMEASPGGAVMGKGSEVFWELAERMPTVQFLGVRGGYGMQDVRNLLNVKVLDHVPHHRMRDEVYARTRVLLMPSSYESWGRVGTEAMASGIPVIAHPTPGLVESLGAAGIFADRGDVEAWVAVLTALTDPAAYATASARSLARAAELDPAADLDRWCKEVEALGR